MSTNRNLMTVSTILFATCWLMTEANGATVAKRNTKTTKPAPAATAKPRPKTSLRPGLPIAAPKRAQTARSGAKPAASATNLTQRGTAKQSRAPAATRSKMTNQTTVAAKAKKPHTPAKGNAAATNPTNAAGTGKDSGNGAQANTNRKPLPHEDMLHWYEDSARRKGHEVETVEKHPNGRDNVITRIFPDGTKETIIAPADSSGRSPSYVLRHRGRLSGGTITDTFTKDGWLRIVPDGEKYLVKPDRSTIHYGSDGREIDRTDPSGRKISPQQAPEDKSTGRKIIDTSRFNRFLDRSIIDPKADDLMGEVDGWSGPSRGDLRGSSKRPEGSIGGAKTGLRDDVLAQIGGRGTARTPSDSDKTSKDGTKTSGGHTSFPDGDQQDFGTDPSQFMHQGTNQADDDGTGNDGTTSPDDSSSGSGSTQTGGSSGAGTGSGSQQDGNGSTGSSGTGSSGTGSTSGNQGTSGGGSNSQGNGGGDSQSTYVVTHTDDGFKVDEYNPDGTYRGAEYYTDEDGDGTYTGSGGGSSSEVPKEGSYSGNRDSEGGTFNVPSSSSSGSGGSGSGGGSSDSRDTGSGSSGSSGDSGSGSSGSGSSDENKSNVGYTPAPDAPVVHRDPAKTAALMRQFRAGLGKKTGTADPVDDDSGDGSKWMGTIRGGDTTSRVPRGKSLITNPSSGAPASRGGSLGSRPSPAPDGTLINPGPDAADASPAQSSGPPIENNADHVGGDSSGNQQSGSGSHLATPPNSSSQSGSSSATNSTSTTTSKSKRTKAPSALERLLQATKRGAQ